jgi:hypothetical protein
VDLSHFLLLSLSAPAVGSNVTCKTKKMQQAVLFILFSPSQICSRSSFFPLLFCSFLLQVVDLAAEEGVLEVGAAGVAVRGGGVATRSALLREAKDWQICGV